MFFVFFLHFLPRIFLVHIIFGRFLLQHSNSLQLRWITPKNSWPFGKLASLNTDRFHMINYISCWWFYTTNEIITLNFEKKNEFQGPLRRQKDGTFIFSIYCIGNQLKQFSFYILFSEFLFICWPELNWKCFGNVEISYIHKYWFITKLWHESFNCSI